VHTQSAPPVTPLTHETAFRLDPIPPYDFALTVRKPGGWDLFTPDERFDGETLWTALHLDGRLVGLRLSATGTADDPGIEVVAFTATEPTPVAADRIRTRLAEKLGATEDLTGFYALAREDPILQHAVADLNGMHSTEMSHLFAAGTLAICLQLTTLDRSLAMMDALVERYGERASFDGEEVGVWPTADGLAGVSPEELARECNLGYRARYIDALADRVRAGAPTLGELRDLPPAEVRGELLSLPGIGEYSADIIAPHTGFPIDVWSVDVFGTLFDGEEPPNRRTAVERIKREGEARWGEWAWLAFVYVVHDLEALSAALGVELRLT
jgi:DNA-3-methyladenine glycosylase II